MVRRSISIGLIAGIIVALGIAFAAVSHNPQGEYLGDDGLPTLALWILCAVWFVIAGVIAGLLSLLANWISSA